MIQIAEEILECGHPPSEHGPHTTGYGTDSEGKRHCFECCAERDKARLIADSRGALYLCKSKYLDGTDRWCVTNWPGTLKIWCYYTSKGRHNIAGTRQDVWFIFDGNVWHGVQYGEWTQVCHVKRTKTVATKTAGL